MRQSRRVGVALFLVTLVAGSAGARAACDIAVVTGYWPPTNEMLRHFSTDRAHNPDGWAGANWRGLGYDVHAFFPEFPPDGDPTNDQIGDVGSVGARGSDFQVDYQDTSADFWRLMDAQTPRVLMTTSRGGDIAWELEAVEGGHGPSSDAPNDPARDWASDRYGRVTYPTQASVDPRSWRAISEYRGGRRLESALPLARIQAAVAALDIALVAIDPNTSGNYLSGFMGLHGLYYERTHPHTVAAGHIHVGRQVRPALARILFEVSLQEVLLAFPATRECTQAVRETK